MSDSKLSRLILAAGASLALCAGALAQSTDAKPAAKPAQKEGEKEAKSSKLVAGNPAPALTIETWVKGDAITGFEKGRVYVVEFWATWCGPCRVSIPHLTEMQKKFKDKVVFIGVTSGEKIETVNDFVKAQAEKMDYTVAFDKGKATSDAWMKAAGRGGIPCSFVVDRESKIAWIGHPMAGLDKVVEKVVAGTFDVAKQAAMEKKYADLQKAVGAAAQDEKWDDALKALDEIAALDDTYARQAALMKFHILLTQKKDFPAAYAWATQLSDGMFKNDAMELNQIAWTILDDEGVEKRDLDVAMKVAQRAAEASKGNDGMILDTLARAYWEKGDKKKAIEVQTTAIAKTDDADMRKQLEETLEKYKTATK